MDSKRQKIPTGSKLKFHDAPGYVCGKIGNCLGGPIDGLFYYSSSLEDHLAWKPDPALTDTGEWATFTDPDGNGKYWVVEDGR